MMSRIVHIIDELKTGGAQTHLRTLLKAWRRAGGHEHVVLSLFGDGDIGPSIRNMGIEVHILDLANLIRQRRYLSAMGEIEQKLESLKPDLTEAHLSFSRILGQFAAQRAGVKRRFSFEHGDIYLNSLLWKAANFFGQYSSEKIIVVSEAMADWMVRTHGVSRARLTVMHNCIDTETFRPSPSPAITRDSLELPKGSFVFCAVGSLGKGVNKRTDITLQALAAAREQGANVALVVCGDGPLRESLETQARGLGVYPFVRFLGVRQDVPDVLKSADALVHAAPFEPFGLVCIEAMSVGLPVLVPDAGGIAEIVEHEVSGLKYPVLDWNELSRAMIRMVQNPEQNRRMAAAGSNYVIKHLTADHYLKNLRAIYGL